MNSIFRSRQHLTQFHLSRWMILCVLAIGIGGFCVMGCPFYHSPHSAAIRSAREALDWVHTLEYDHIVSSSFFPEAIDLDGNGQSLFETRSIRVSDNTPFSGMKTIDIIVSWPKSGAPLSAGSEPVAPDLDSVRISLMIDQRYFS